MLKKDTVAIFFVCLFGFLAQTAGYDLYHHTQVILEFSEFEDIRKYNIFGIMVPRYLLGYYVPSILINFIPSFFAFLLPFFFTFYFANLNLTLSNKKRYQLTFFSLGAFVSLRFNMLSWSLLALTSLLLTSERSKLRFILYFVAAGVHPVGFFLSIILALLKRDILGMAAIFIVALVATFLGIGEIS